MEQILQFLRTPGREIGEVEPLIDEHGLNAFWRALAETNNRSVFDRALDEDERFLPDSLDERVVESFVQKGYYNRAARLMNHCLIYKAVPDDVIKQLPRPERMKQSAIEYGGGLLIERLFKHHDLTARSMDFDYAVQQNAVVVVNALMRRGSFSDEAVRRLFIRSTKRLFADVSERHEGVDPYSLSSLFGDFATYGLPNYDPRYGRAHPLSGEKLELGSPHERADSYGDDAPSSVGFVFATYRSLDDPPEEASELLFSVLSTLFEHGHAPRKAEVDALFEWGNRQPYGGRELVLKELMRHNYYPDVSLLEDLVDRVGSVDWEWDDLLNRRTQQALEIG